MMAKFKCKQCSTSFKVSSKDLPTLETEINCTRNNCPIKRKETEAQETLIFSAVKDQVYRIPVIIEHTETDTD